jgi:hypothetical protein
MMKMSLVIALSLVVVGCGKKNDEGASNPPAGDKSAPGDKAADKAAPAAPAGQPDWAKDAMAMLPEAGVLPECDAMTASFKKGVACTKLNDTQHAGLIAAITGVQGVVAGYKTETDKDKKDTLKTAAAGMCKDQDAQLKKTLAEGGC